MDCKVKIYELPGGDLLKTFTNWKKPIQALSFCKSGTFLVVGGKDCVITRIHIKDGSVNCKLHGHGWPIIGIASDPRGEYLASVDSVGTVLIWDLETADTISNLERIGMNTYDSYVLSNSVAWSPDGEKLAISTNKSDVTLFKRDGSERLCTFSHPIRLPIYYLDWSPNGRYIATSGLDRTVIIWDSDKNTIIDSCEFDDIVASIAWKPSKNALALIVASIAWSPPQNPESVMHCFYKN